MANTNTDLTEEDAADLQFPKASTSKKPASEDILNTSSTSSSGVTSILCANCFSELICRYIMCEQCKINVCLCCFSNGAEFGGHENNHDYRVLTTNIILFENSDWTAEEELKLLDSLMSYGNWGVVALDLPNRCIEEIKQHYEYFYLDRKGNKGLPKFETETKGNPYELVVPYRFRLTDSEDPPRYSSNSVGYQCLAGYNPTRGDFENEYDKNAEDLIAHLETIEPEDPHYDLLTNLQCSIVASYNRRLKERQRWKKIIASHGLLVLRKTISWLHRYDMTITRSVYERLLRFMQYCDPTNFNMLMEGLHRAGELKIHIQRLIHLRKKGITTLAEGRLYLKLQEKHLENRKQLKMFRSCPEYSWKNHKTLNPSLKSKCLKQRRSLFAPIEIIGMPGYEKLTDDEKDICSTIRLVPATYLELKEVLIAENQRMGHVRLQTARRLLKIDVNKTRKMYDFLVEKGYIKK